MTKSDFDLLREKFDDFSLRLDARIAEFKHDGMFATTHAAYVKRVLEGHADVEARLAAAAHRGDVWEASKAELTRDLNALIGDFAHLEEALDAQMMRQ
jgi:hypothetical protein